MIFTHPRQKILIVDDAPSDIKILREGLKSDYEIAFAINGDDALKVVRSGEPPDLVLLDLMMPGMDGYELCERLKSDDKTRGISVVFLTVRNEERFETQGFQVGAIDYITKPFSLQVVKARVRTHLESKRQRDLLENLSSIDELTGIANRRRFDVILSLEWRRAVRRAVPLALVLVDIDYFKAFNDTYGHPAGDDCLRTVARALAASLERAGDVVARYGGEEFAVVLPDTDSQRAGDVGERLRAAVDSLNIRHSDSPVADRVTISLGAASTFPQNEVSPQSLTEAADNMLYEAKKEGRNRVRSVTLDHTPASRPTREKTDERV